MFIYVASSHLPVNYTYVLIILSSQPISEICQRVRSLKRQKGETEKVLLHTDAAQAIGKISVDVQELGVDYLTIVGHKVCEIVLIYKMQHKNNQTIPVSLY